MPSNRTALIIGASRGIGLGLVRQLHADGWQVTATVRDPARATDLQALQGVHIESLDIDDAAALRLLTQRLSGQVFDLLFVNAGILGPSHQSAAAATAEELGQLFLTNVVAPIRLAEQLVGRLRLNRRAGVHELWAGQRGQSGGQQPGAVQGQQGGAQFADQQLRL